MICNNCSVEIPDGQKYCTSCGIKLGLIGIECNNCEAVNALNSNFCGNCGAMLGSVKKATSSTPYPDDPEPMEDERKLASILFADVHGFTAMSENLDPEAVRNLMDQCFARLTAIIVRYGGVVDKYMGDSVMAIFGAPISHEDDDLRAILTGMALQEEIKVFSKSVEDKIKKPLSMRVGINTGLVMAGRVGGENNRVYTVMGDAVNLASRLEQACEVGGVLISESTYSGTASLVKTELPKSIKVKGKNEPITVYQVKGVEPNFQLRLTAEQFETPFVDRDIELNQLKEHLLAIRFTRQPQLVAVVGPAFVGKTRLVAELIGKHQGEFGEAAFFYGAALNYLNTGAFGVISDIIRHLFDMRVDDTPANQQSQLLYGLAEYVWAAHGVPLEAISFPTALPESLLIFNKLSAPQQECLKIAYHLGSMMGLPYAGNPFCSLSYRDIERNVVASPGINPDEIRRILRGEIMTHVEQLFKHLCRARPVYLLIDNADVCDAETLEIACNLTKTVDQMAFGVILLSRRAVNLPQNASCATTVLLSRLPATQFDGLMSNVLHSTAGIPLTLSEHLYQRCSGIPGLAELLAKHYWQQQILVYDEDSGNWRFAHRLVNTVGLPTKIVQWVQANVDKLTQLEKFLLQTAAVMGRTFWQGLLENLGEFKDIPGILPILVEKGLIAQSSTMDVEDKTQYYFIDALCQEIVIETTPKVRREKLHAKIIQWLIGHQLDKNRAFFEIIARHYIQAGNFIEAHEFLLRAGQAALEDEKIKQALDFYEDALTLIMDHDPNDHPRLALIYERLGDIHQEDEDYQNVTKYYRLALEHMIVIESVSEDWRDPQTYRHANLQLKLAHVYQIRGDFAKAQTLIDNVLKSLGEEDVSKPRVFVLLLLSNIFRARGQYQTAEQYAVMSLNYAHQLNDPPLIWRCCDVLGDLYRAKGDFTQAIKHFNHAYKGRKEANNMIGLANSVRYLGQTTVDQGQADKGIPYLEKCVALFENLKLPREQSRALNLLGKIHLEHGHFPQAGDCFERAYQNMRGTSNYAYEAAYYFYMGKTRYCTGDLKDCYQMLDVAIKKAERLENIILIIKTYIEICKISTAMRYSGRALNTIELAIEMSRQVGLEPLMARALLQQAESHLVMDYRQSALNSCLKALEIIERDNIVDNFKYHGHALRVLGDIYVKSGVKGDETKAGNCYKESINILGKKISHPYLLAKSCVSYGLFLKQHGEEASSDTLLTKARELFTQMGAKHELAAMG